MNSLPLFSIIIPTYNRPALLRSCLAALAALDYPLDCYEVVVVDDGGPQPLDTLVWDFQNRLTIRLLRQHNAGPGAARNTGAAVATGDYLAFTDDDCRPEPGWLRAFAAAYETRPTSLLGGRTQNGLAGNLYSEASQAVQAWFYDYCAAHASPLRFFASNNISLPTALFREIGGFDTSIRWHASEDRELCGRWLARGGAMVYVPEARMAHCHCLALLSFLRQHYAYGRGAFQLRQMRRRQGLPPLPGDLKWVVLSLARYPLEYRWRGLLLSVLTFASHAANALGSVYESKSSARPSS